MPGVRSAAAFQFAVPFSSDTDATGKGGNIAIEARDIAIRSGGDVSASTYGSADAGEISVRASGVRPCAARLSAYQCSAVA